MHMTIKPYNAKITDMTVYYNHKGGRQAFPLGSGWHQNITISEKEHL